MNISYEENVYLSEWVLDSRPKCRLNFHTGQAIAGTRKTSCDVEIHCVASDIANQYSDVHLPPQVKGFGGLERFEPERKKGKNKPSQKSDDTNVSDESNKASFQKIESISLAQPLIG